MFTSNSHLPLEIRVERRRALSVFMYFQRLETCGRLLQACWWTVASRAPHLHVIAGGNFNI